ncbi:MAG: DUF4838 domain-containing protein [Planctomycetota bacterium]|jgi:hypothetical protein
MKLFRKIILVNLLSLVAISWNSGASANNNTSSSKLKTAFHSDDLTPITWKADQSQKQSARFFVNGKSSFKIVYPAENKESSYYKELALLLQKHLGDAAGIKLPVIADSNLKSEDAKNLLLIGKCNHADSSLFAEKVSTLKNEGFIIASHNSNIIIIGRDSREQYGKKQNPMTIKKIEQERGTFFGVIDFLERICGFRFYFPLKFGTIIPDLKSVNITVEPGFFTDAPQLQTRTGSIGLGRSRDVKLVGYNRDKAREWQLSMRHGNIYIHKTGHTISNYWSKMYGKSRPELFALRDDGTRAIGSKGIMTTQMCYGNPAFLKEYLKIIREFYKTGKGVKFFKTYNRSPNDKYIYWWPNDGYRGCLCSDCKKIADPKADFINRDSRIIWDFGKRLAEAVKKEFPGKKLIFPVYGTWYERPKDIVMPDNVVIFVCLAHVIEGFAKEERYYNYLANQFKDLQKQSCEPVQVWTHYPIKPRLHNGLEAPALAPHILSKLFRELSPVIGGLYINGSESVNFLIEGLIFYQYMKMTWNENIDPDALLKRYCENMFGEAAGEIRAYFNAVINRWENVKWKDLPDKNDGISRRIPWENYYLKTYPRDFRMKWQANLNKALKTTVKNPLQAERVKAFVEVCKPFFTQAAFLEQGKVLSAEAVNLTPEIDGNLKEWQKINAAEIQFVENTTREKVPQYKTYIHWALDKENLYLAGYVHEEEELLLLEGKSKTRDQKIWNKDSIEIFLCPPLPGLEEAGYPPESQYYQIAFDALGRVWDGYKAPGKQGADSKTDLKLELKTEKSEKGFTFEMAIPFKSLGMKVPGANTFWPVNVYRNRRRHGIKQNTAFAWSATMSAFNKTSRFARLVFSGKKLYSWGEDSFDSYLNGMGYVMLAKTGKKVLATVQNETSMSQEGISVENNVEENILKIKCGFNPQNKKPGSINIMQRKLQIQPEKAAVVRLKYRAFGKGLMRVKLIGTSNQENFSHTQIIEKGRKELPWQEITVTETDKGSPLTGIDKLGFNLQFRSGSEVTFEIAYLDVLEN